MINGIRFKVCGLTSLVDAELADQCGADFLGFIVYPKSPRYLPLAAFTAMANRVPARKKVAVCVAPSREELKAYVDAGFDLFQIHFPYETPLATIAEWMRVAGHPRVWLAPKLPPGEAFKEEWTELADTFLWDTFHANSFGGTGATGDWPKFKQAKASHVGKTWILAGGLNPENITDALKATGTTAVDVNSGVELSPGVKDHAKLKALVLAIHRATVAGNSAYTG